MPLLFAALKREIISVENQYTFEIILTIDPSYFSNREWDLLEDLRLMSLGASVNRILQIPGGYYEQKMRAAELAQGDVLVFVDCDVVPDKGWLRCLLAPLDEESVLLVCGRTYVLPSGFFANLCSDVWLFDRHDERCEDQTISLASTFHANNFAVRRATFERFCFPQFESFRGQCRAAAYDMDKAGLAIWCASAAKVAHPAPEGVFAYLIRAFRRGSDLIAIGQYIGMTGMELARYVLRGIERNLWQPLKRLRTAFEMKRIGVIGYICAGGLTFVSVSSI